MTSLRESVAAVVRDWVASHDLVFEEPSEFTFVVVLPGEHKLRTAVSLVVGEHSLSVDAFVMRHPEDNVEAVQRWLLERNTKLTMVSYALDHLGDVYLSGRVPLAAITDDLLDAVMGQVLDASDGPFNLLLEMGFESAIRREWAWRLDRGEPTGNLEAFGHLRPGDDPSD